MLKSIQSNNSPGHTHNGQTSVVDLSTDFCPGNHLTKSNKMEKISIQINNYEKFYREVYTTSVIIDLIRDLSAKEYDNCSEEEKRRWVIRCFKECINEEIDLLFKDKNKVVI